MEMETVVEEAVEEEYVHVGEKERYQEKLSFLSGGMQFTTADMLKQQLKSDRVWDLVGRGEHGT